MPEQFGSSYHSVDLSSTRIQDVVKALRRVSLEFASIVNSRITARLPVRATYSTRVGRRGGGNLERTVEAPLALLPPPLCMNKSVDCRLGGTRLSICSEKHYAVRESYETAVQMACGSEVGLNEFRSSREVPSLVALCSAILGAAMGSEDEASLFDSEDIIQVSYNSIPPPYRGCTLISHATAIVVAVCPPNATLLRLVLNICIQRGLPYESSTVLRALLCFASSKPSSRSSPPLSHPAHTSYLTELWCLWSDAGYSNRTFIRILVDVLVEVHFPEVWMCKAMSAFALHMRRKQFHSLAILASGLAEAIHALESNDGAELMDVGVGDVERIQNLKRRFADWIKVILEDMMNETFSTPARLTPEYEAVIDLLTFAKGSCMNLGSYPGLKASTSEGCISSILSGAVISLATHVLYWLSSLLIAYEGEIQATVDLLNKWTPSLASYTDMITNIFNPRCDSGSLFVGDFTTKKRILERYTHTLRSYHLFRLETCLYACALHHIERSQGLRPIVVRGDLKSVEWLRNELISLVEESEQRCFGAGRHLAQAGFTQIAGATELPESSWYWEDLVGCWVRPSPAKPTRASSFVIGCAKDEPTTVSSSSLLSAADMGKENTDGSSISWSSVDSKTSRKSTMFASILSNMSTNCEILHNKHKPTYRHPAPSVAAIACDSHKKRRLLASTPIRGPEEQDFVDGTESDADDILSCPLSSEDSLNLFACNSSPR